MRVRALLEGGAVIDEPGPFYPPPFLGHTPLMLASERGNEEIVRVLVANGAVVDRESEHLLMTALSAASLAGHAGVVRILLDAGASGNVGALFVAARSGRQDVIDVLLASGVDVNHQATATLPARNYPDPGETALMVAAQRGHIEAVKALLAAGASVHLKDNEGRTALSHTMLRVISVVTSTGLDGTHLGTKITLPSEQEVIFDLLIEAGAQPKGFIESLYAAGAR